MDSEADHAILQATLDELAHLLLEPSRLTIIKDSEVGSGGYWAVCLAMLDATSKVAVKQLRIIQAKGMRVRVAVRLPRELKVWAKTKHPNVLKLVGYYLSENYGPAQLVSPYMENGNVTEYVQRTQPTIETRLAFVRGVTSGMAYLHSREPPICHGDLIPVIIFHSAPHEKFRLTDLKANVLISDKPDAVLCDFGLANFVENSGQPSGLTTSRSIKGSLRYMSPELFEDDEAKHTLESDIWAWACTTSEIITNVIPYATSRNDGSLMMAVGRGASPASMELMRNLAEVDLSSPSILSALQALIPECWNVDPRKRPPASSIMERLNYVDRANSDLPPAQPSYDEKQTNTSVLAGRITIQLSNQPRRLEYNKMKLNSRKAHGWVTEVAPEPEVVLHLDDPFSKGDMNAAPNGKWMAISFPSGITTVWNLEICLPHR
ncbi:hypothetical protein FRC01_009507 [Tulasnella sp. 417]|nr:hypothetical protein FRC01_009507 [Tulasnella sp. 417]